MTNIQEAIYELPYVTDSHRGQLTNPFVRNIFNFQSSIKPKNKIKLINHKYRVTQ